MTHILSPRFVVPPPPTPLSTVTCVFLFPPCASDGPSPARALHPHLRRFPREGAETSGPASRGIVREQDRARTRRRSPFPPPPTGASLGAIVFGVSRALPAMGREARSPPRGGRALGAVAGKSDIAPVATAPEFRTPGGSKSMRRAPWRSPGVAPLARRDDNARDPVVRAPRVGKRNARKLDARSPATAAAGRPAEEADRERSPQTPRTTTSGSGRPATRDPRRHRAAAAADDGRRRRASLRRRPAPRLLPLRGGTQRPPHRHLRLRLRGPHQPEPGDGTASGGLLGTASTRPRPPREPPGLPSGASPDAIDDAVPEPNDSVDPVAAAVRPSFGTREPPTLGPIAALPDEATDGGSGGDFEDDAGDDVYPSEGASLPERRRKRRRRPARPDRRRPRASSVWEPLLGAGVVARGGGGAALGGSLFTPAHGVADLTPLAPHAMRGGDAAPTMTMGMHLPTPTMDLTPLRRGRRPGGVVPRMRCGVGRLPRGVPAGHDPRR